MSRAHVVSPSELSSLRDLELRVKSTVEGLRQGLHRSPFHGFTEEFSQYRHYRPGDDLKYIDWKAFARTDRLYSRQFRETTNLAALLVLDSSGSMAFPESPSKSSKLALAGTAAAVLATLVIDQGDAAGVLAMSGEGAGDTRFVPPRSGRHHLHLCLSTLARLRGGGSAGVSGALARVPAVLRRRGLVIVLSDFYEEEPALLELRRLARMGHEVIAVQVMAAGELTLPRGGSIEFEDLETGSRVITNVAAAADEYHANLRTFLAGTRQRIEADGMSYLRLVTEEPLEPALRSFLVSRRGTS